MCQDSPHRKCSVPDRVEGQQPTRAVSCQGCSVFAGQGVKWDVSAVSVPTTVVDVRISLANGPLSSHL